MRWPVLLLSFAVLAFVGSAGDHPAMPVAAQEATPCPLWPPLEQGVMAWEVGEFMQWPSTILMEIAPGVSQPGDDGKLGAQLINLVYMQSGVLTLRTEVPMAVHRGKAHGDPEAIPAGTEFTVEAGDYYVTGPVTPSMKNNGPDPATFQLSRLDPEPLVIDRCAPLG